LPLIAARQASSNTPNSSGKQTAPTKKAPQSSCRETAIAGGGIAKSHQRRGKRPRALVKNLQAYLDKYPEAPERRKSTVRCGSLHAISR